MPTLRNPLKDITYLQDLGGKSDWSLDTQVLALRTIDKFCADLLERCDLSGSESDSDLVDFLIIAQSLMNVRLIVQPQATISSHRPTCNMDVQTYWAFAAEILLWLLERHVCDMNRIDASCKVEIVICVLDIV